MANPYFGDFGDVWKHLVLMELLARVRPRHYWETNAGSASYPLSRSPERRYGVFYFLENAEERPVLRDSRYWRALAQLPHTAGLPSVYAGSALLAMIELGTAANYLFCDVDAESVAGLQLAAREIGLSSHVRCLAADGVSSVRRAATRQNVRERSSVVVHVDPFEPQARSAPGEQTPLELCTELARVGFKVALWYAHEPAHHRPGWPWHHFVSGPGGCAKSVWCGDLALPETATARAEVNQGLQGCGVVCANFSVADYAVLTDLGTALASLYGTTTAPTGQHGALLFTSLGPETAC